MPNKHKNRDKGKPPVPAPMSYLPTPPPTPQDFVSRDSQSEWHKPHDTSRAPPTMVQSSYDYLTDFISQLSQTPIIHNGVELDMDARAARVKVEPLMGSAFPRPTYNVANADRTHIPIDYHRMPNPLDGQTAVVQEHGIGQYSVKSETSSVVAQGLFAIDTPNSHKRSSTRMMASWLEDINGRALDLDLDVDALGDYARVVWRIISCLPAVPVDTRKRIMDALGADIDLRRIALGRPRKMLTYGPDYGGDRYGYEGDLPGVITDWALQGDIIQYHSTWPIQFRRAEDSLHGPQWTPTGDLQALEKVQRSMVHEVNKLCKVVDLNHNSMPHPTPVLPTSSAAVAAYYADVPIDDHIQASPMNQTTYLRVPGERVWTSAKSVAECRLVMFKNLKYPMRHIGQTVLCRVITRPRVHGGISFLVEDSNSHVLPVTIMYPFPFAAISYTPAVVQTAWPVGTICYIKEPYVRYGARGRAEILVAWPKDLVEVPRVAGIFDDPWVDPATQDLGLYRLAAQMAWSQGKPKLAIRLAALGLNLASVPQHCAPVSIDQDKYLDLLIGRAAAYSVNDQPGAAFSDCLEADGLLKLSSRPEQQLLSRRVKIIQLRVTYKLKLFSVSGFYLKTCSQLGVDARFLDPYRKAVKDRGEELKGIYHSIDARDPLGKAGQRATFVGPIKVTNDPIKGRKLVLAKDVKAGELLLMEPPVVQLTYNGSPGVSLTSMLASGDMGSKPSPHNISWALHQIMDDPSVGQCIHSLSPDPDLEISNLGMSEQERLRIFEKPTETEVDLLERQIDRNAFGIEGSYTLMGMISMISHSCKQNVVKINSDTDSTTMVRALNDMKAGEEITVCYIPPERSYEARRGSLLRSWFFECDCPLCKADQHAKDMPSIRVRLMDSEWLVLQQDLSRQSGSSLLQRQPIINRLLTLANKLDATYASGRKAKLELSKVCFALGDLYTPCDATQALKHYLDGYAHLEWEFSSPEQIKTSGKFIRTIGYLVDGDSALIHMKRFLVIKNLYYRKNQSKVGDAAVESCGEFLKMFMGPTIDNITESDLAKKPLDTVPPNLAGQPHTGGLRNPLADELFAKTYKTVTLPDGTQEERFSFKGTPFEGQEEWMRGMLRKRGMKWSPESGKLGLE